MGISCGNHCANGKMSSAVLCVNSLSLVLVEGRRREGGGKEEGEGGGSSSELATKWDGTPAKQLEAARTQERSLLPS